MRALGWQMILLSTKYEAPTIDPLSHFIMQQACQTMMSPAKIRQSCANLLHVVAQKDCNSQICLQSLPF
jgi:hypothetical protein